MSSEWLLSKRFLHESDVTHFLFAKYVLIIDVIKRERDAVESFVS
jgi:hypothetical protein